MKYHIGIAGAGFAGAVLARELADSGKFRITIFDERNHVGGNCHTQRDEETGVMIHQYGSHIFHTGREDVWEYVNQWGKFEPFVNRVKAQTSKGIFNLPINLMTINQLFQKKFRPSEARDFVGGLGDPSIQDPKNLEEYALKYFGKEIYDNFIKGYSLKKWGVSPRELPASLLKRLSIRFNYDDDYYDHQFQGIPVSGYTEIIKRILDHHEIEIRTGQRLEPERKRDFDHTFWCGPMDGFFKYQLGKLGYRTLHFERFVDNEDYQGNAIINFCEEDVPYLRISEYKHFMPWEDHEHSVCFKEYAKNCEENDVPYYPTRLNKDLELLERYMALSTKEDNITFVGRLGTYRYLEMHAVIGESLDLARLCLKTDVKEWPKFSADPLT